MATDALLQFAASQTITTTTSFTASSGIPVGTPYRTNYCSVIITDGHSSSTNTLVLSIDVSTDGGSTYSIIEQLPAISLTTTVLTGEYTLHYEFHPRLQAANSLLVRLTATLTGGGTPSVTLSASGVTGPQVPRN